jgi:hypothetical protein
VGRRAQELAERGHEIEFFALDLTAAENNPRVKVYFRHNEMPLAEMDTVAALASQHDAARSARARHIIYGRTGGTVSNEPMTCLAFRAGTTAPEEANVYLRLPDNARSDAEASDRVTELMRVEGIDAGPYRDVMAALAPAPADSTTGLQELLSYRTIGDHADLGLYLRFSTYGRPVDPRLDPGQIRLDADQPRACSRRFPVSAGNTRAGGPTRLRRPPHRWERGPVTGRSARPRRRSAPARDDQPLSPPPAPGHLGARQAPTDGRVGHPFVETRQGGRGVLSPAAGRPRRP